MTVHLKCGRNISIVICLSHVSHFCIHILTYSTQKAYKFHSCQKNHITPFCLNAFALFVCVLLTFQSFLKLVFKPVKLIQTCFRTGARSPIRNSTLAGVRGIVFRLWRFTFLSFWLGFELPNSCLLLATRLSSSIGSVNFIWAIIDLRIAWGTWRKKASTTYE